MDPSGHKASGSPPRFPRPRAGMDLPHVPGRDTGHRFPRPRGDGPRTAAPHVRGALVSPPTRGWTREGPNVSVGQDGFPAHAGMDPPCGSSARSRARFPRPRGDGPCHEYMRLTVSMVSPPTRGWTLLIEEEVRLQVGFPAHAGMDPWRYCGVNPLDGFPRPRGDGPFSSNNTVRMNTVSPPTRGWTLRSTSRNRWSCGFPAHAGMDRDRAPSRAGRFGFPRPRGDGPSSRIMVAISSAVSPPTRGWTVRLRLRHGRGLGFPAHAGMDPVFAAGSMT